MQKRYFFIIVSLAIISFFLFNYNRLFYKQDKIDISKDEKESKETLRGYNGLAIMLQNEKGEYVVSDSDTWPTDEYVFNEVLSSCENGGKLSWNDGKITLKTSGSDKCYVYFDKISIIQNNNLQILLTNAAKMDQETVGELVHHTQDVPNSANDNAYRYSGNNPNNFICFGAGSEDYNNGKVETCELTNQYRIIGIVPVTTADGKQENLIKVIKSEYITEEELGMPAGYKNRTIDSDFSQNLRIQKTTGLHTFLWNENTNTWPDGKYYWANGGKRSTLNNALNTTYLNTTLGEKWSEKIENIQWNVGGIILYDIPSVMKTNEENKEVGGSIKSTDKIGLMYIYDYGFATSKNNWGISVGDYDGSYLNWLYTGVYEWTISHEFNSGNAYYIDGVYQFISDDNVEIDDYTVRPVFYLKSSVKLIADNKTDGTYLHPYRIG